jgi:hypothetical protein
MLLSYCQPSGLASLLALQISGIVNPSDVSGGANIGDDGHVTTP